MENCPYHPGNPAMENCSVCGTALCDLHREGGPPICPACAARQALSDLDRGEQRRQKVSRTRREGRKKSRRIWSWGRWILVFVLAAWLVFQVPRMMDTLGETPSPVRVGPQNTEPVTDDCIRNLWLISKSIQQGGRPDPGLRCPACERPYVLEGQNKIESAACPCPESHGLSGIRVSRDAPVPGVEE